MLLQSSRASGAEIRTSRPFFDSFHLIGWVGGGRAAILFRRAVEGGIDMRILPGLRAGSAHSQDQTRFNL